MRGFLERRELVPVIIAAAILSLSALYFYSLTIGPMALPIGDLNEGLVGRWVQTVGEVKEARLSSTGLWLLLRDPLDFSEIAAFARRDVYEAFQDKGSIAPGAEVQVTGELQLYRGELEILMTSAKDLVLLREAQS